MTIKQFIVGLTIAGLVWLSPSAVQAQTKIFTTAELAAFDGKDGRSAYYAYEGKVYDVTTSKLWKLGEHFGVQAGKDLTGMMEGAPHGTEVFSGFPIVGAFGNGAEQSSVSPAALTEEEPAVAAEAEVAQPWYTQRLKVAGISLLGWTGILLAVFFIFTFGTCFAMPWAKLPLPWKGNKIGPDPLDQAGAHLNWSSIHKYFVWFVVVLGLIHGILGFMQMFWGIYV